MGDARGTVEWYRPLRRALFPTSGMRVSSSLRKRIRSGRFEVRFDTQFERVVRGCLRPDDNWITEEIIAVYTRVHLEGWGHSAECWRAGDLVGGVYGIALGSCFSAESMYYREPDASKVALCALIEKCAELGFTLFDAQVMNLHLASLGAYEVEQAEYMAFLAEALTRSTPWSE